MINKMVVANLVHRPTRSLITMSAIALEVTMILLVVALFITEYVIGAALYDMRKVMEKELRRTLRQGAGEHPEDAPNFVKHCQQVEVKGHQIRRT